VIELEEILIQVSDWLIPDQTCKYLEIDSNELEALYDQGFFVKAMREPERYERSSLSSYLRGEQRKRTKH